MLITAKVGARLNSKQAIRVGSDQKAFGMPLNRSMDAKGLGRTLSLTIREKYRKQLAVFTRLSRLRWRCVCTFGYCKAIAKQGKVKVVLIPGRKTRGTLGVERTAGLKLSKIG